jgi:2Fe-2S ferredoxin
MVKITYIDVDGGEQVVEAKVGQSVMEAAVKNGVSAIVAECGGNCACGTCRVYIDPKWKAVTGERHEKEAGMIEFSGESDPNARLSCQIRVTEALDGLVVRTPESQYS